MSDEWSQILVGWREWRDHGDRVAATQAFGLLEAELRSAIPAMVLREFSAPEIDDLIQQILENLSKKDPPDLDHPRAFFREVLRNQAIDNIRAARARDRRESEATPVWEEERDLRQPQHPDRATELQEIESALSKCISLLSLQDRTLLKAKTMPLHLAEDELEFLIETSGRSRSSVRKTLDSDDDYELYLLFSPGDETTDRRRLMERFRKRRARLRDALKNCMEGRQ